MARSEPGNLLGKGGSLAHAYLLAGHSGLGKNAFAERLAQSMLCKHPTPFACGHCQSCHLFTSATHPDLHVLQSEKYSLDHPGLLSRYAERHIEHDNSRKKPSAIISVDQVRDVLPDINTRPHMASCRIIVLNPAENLNINAANSLLKALEEPPADTYFLLISHDPGRLLPTLRSRCNRIDFRMPDTAITEAWLSAQLGDAQLAAALLRKARGIPLRALNLAQGGGEDGERRVSALLSGLADDNIDPVTAAADIMKDKEFELRGVLVSIQRLIAELIKGNAGLTVEKTRLHEIGNRLHSRELFGFLDKVSQSVRQVDTPLDEGLLLEDILSCWQELFFSQKHEPASKR